MINSKSEKFATNSLGKFILVNDREYRLKITWSTIYHPLGNVVGADRDNANYLYFIAYNIYALVLQISTAGIPVAISKIVADNHARRDYKTSWRLFKGTMLFMRS